MRRLTMVMPIKQRTLSFGVTMTIGEYILAEPLCKYLQKHPDLDVKIHYGNTSELLKALQEGIIDFALVEGYFPEAGYETKIFGREKFIPVCAAGHHLKRKPEKIQDLFCERLLIRESGSGTRNILERNLAVHNYTVGDFCHYVEVENMHTILQLLLGDCGVSFLYRAAVKKELEEGRLEEVLLSDFQMEHDFTFLWEKESLFAEDYRAICEELCCLSQYLPDGQ